MVESFLFTLILCTLYLKNNGGQFHFSLVTAKLANNLITINCIGPENEEESPKARCPRTDIVFKLRQSTKTKKSDKLLDDDHGDVINESTITNSLSYKMQKLWNEVAAVFEEI